VTPRTPEAWILGLTSWRRIFAHDRKAAFLRSQDILSGGIRSWPELAESTTSHRWFKITSIVVSQLISSLLLNGRVLSQFFPLLPIVSNLSPVGFQLDPSLILDTTSSLDYILVILVNLI
jgi:hypothetical protein